jgi:hypothetical protein
MRQALALFVLLAGLFGAEALPRGPQKAEETSPAEARKILEALRRLKKADVVFTATLANVTEGPAALSESPIRSYLLKFTGVVAKRGKAPQMIEAWYQICSARPLTFKIGETYQVGARMADGKYHVEVIYPGPTSVVERTEPPFIPRRPNHVWDRFERPQK